MTRRTYARHALAPAARRQFALVVTAVTVWAVLSLAAGVAIGFWIVAATA